MAVFMINICKFNGCGLVFPGLGDLIQHIEDTHIDYDPIVVQQKEQSQPSCIPLSYVLRFYTDAARKENVADARKRPSITSSGTGMKCSNSSSSIGSSLRSSTPTGSDMEDEDGKTDSEDSNDSWTTPEEFSADFILNLAMKSKGTAMNKKNSTGTWTANAKDSNNMEKPFACPVPGCKKRYKNVNGIKYHSKNGHKKDGKVRKGFKCHCGKSYKTAQGLKTHTSSYHGGTNLTTVATSTGEILQIPAPQVTTLQPLRTLTVKQISASSITSLGLPVKSIQGVVLTTKHGNDTANKSYELESNKGGTLRVLKDIGLPLVKTNMALQLAPPPLQSIVNTPIVNTPIVNTPIVNTSIINTPIVHSDINAPEIIDGIGGGGILDEIEHISDLVCPDPNGEDIPVMNLDDINIDCPMGELDNENLFKIKLEPEKDNFIKLISNDDIDKIHVAPVQIKFPDPQFKLTTIKPTAIKLSSPQVIASLKSRLSPSFDSINFNNRPPLQESLGILTPAASPLTSPENRFNPLQHKPPLSPVLPLTPVSPIQNNKIYAPPNNLQTPEPNEDEKMNGCSLFLDEMDTRPDN